MSNKKQRKVQAEKKSSAVVWAGLFTVLLVVAGSIWYLTSNSSDTNSAPTGTLSANMEVPGEWGMGNPDAKLRIVEFGDYQCGACAFFHPIIKEVMEEYYDEVYFVWHHFPLVNSHQFAVMAASAAEAAGRQGKFWEMHDLIMSNQQLWARGMASSAFLSYARQLGLDDEQFLRDVRDEEILERIERQYNLGISLNIRAVPSFFINGELVPNPPNATAFKALIETKLAELE
ncbi:MAG: DsbA family protein [Bacteroidetes bacterium]|nr:DsbA family protein [Bacteroidota bacterium]MCH8524687.1 DsbA family protein [Balneolales bacterium]